MAYFQTNEEKNITTGNDSISYYDNMRDAQTLFFIHGSFIDRGYWKNQLEYFSPKYRVIAIDLLGHGKSTHNRESYTIDDYAADIVSVIDNLDLKDVILIGHSIGADIMLATNAKIPENIKGLISIDYFKNPGYQFPAEVIDHLMADLQSNFANANEQYARQALLSDKTDSTIIERVVQNFRTANFKVGISMNYDFFHFPKREIALLTNLDKKLYLINSEYQPTNENALSGLLERNYVIKKIPGSCHFPMIEYPNEVNAAIMEFVQQIVEVSE